MPSRPSRRPARGHLPRTRAYVIYGVFARGVRKHRVLRCFVAFGVAEIHLGTIKKPRVLRGFRAPGRPRKEKNDKLKEFQHSLAELVDMMRQHRAKTPAPKADTARVLAGGLRLVTEGYSGEPAQPPTSSGSPPPYQSLRNLRCFLRVVLKNIVFYGVLGPSAFRNFILALSKNHAFYVVWGFRGGARNGKNDMLEAF